MKGSMPRNSTAQKVPRAISSVRKDRSRLGSTFQFCFASVNERGSKTAIKMASDIHLTRKLAARLGVEPVLPGPAPGYPSS